MVEQFNLYKSEGCHLCDLALNICYEQISRTSLTLVDIVDDSNSEALVALYGVHIPVLKRISDGKSLYWPFTSEQVSELK